MALARPAQFDNRIFRHFHWLIAVLRALEFGIAAGSAELSVTIFINGLGFWLDLLCGCFFAVTRNFPAHRLSFFLMLHLIQTRNAARVSSLQYFLPRVTTLIRRPVFGAALSRVGFVGLFITEGGFLIIHPYEQASAHQTG